MAAQSSQFPAQHPIDSAQFIAGIAPFLQIAHQVPGRVRLKLSAAAGDLPALAAGGEALRQALGMLPGVRAIQINPLARSCVVEYDRAMIPDAAWPDVLADRRTPAAATLLDLLDASTSSTCTTRRKEKTS